MPAAEQLPSALSAVRLALGDLAATGEHGGAYHAALALALLALADRIDRLYRELGL